MNYSTESQHGELFNAALSFLLSSRSDSYLGFRPAESLKNLTGGPLICIITAKPTAQ
jgi:hypothetical protein